MTLLIAAYLGGVLTIVSPCILPVLPFVFARAGQSFPKVGLPMLLGMAVTFAAVASLAAVAGEWAVTANQYGRWIAMVVLMVFGLALLFPALSGRIMAPLVAFGARLQQSAEASSSASSPKMLSSVVLGIATGFLWAPCAGPILGLILTGAALQGANAHTSLLLLAYALGATTSIAFAFVAGGRVLTVMKVNRGKSALFRGSAGVAVIVAVVAVSLGLDTGLLARLSTASTAAVEQTLLDRIGAALEQKKEPPVAMTPPAMMVPPAMMAPPAMTAPPAMMMRKDDAAVKPESLPVEGAMPPLSGAVEWLNSPALTQEQLRGKVVMVDFWTYSCINCLRSLPYVRAWHEKYKDKGLVVISVHSPEFAFEKNIANVKKAIVDLKIDNPVAVDNNYAIWRSFKNRFWPAHYFIDAKGQIRHHHFGEGSYEQSERVIQILLAELSAENEISNDLVKISPSGSQLQSDVDKVRSPETYIGYERAENFISPSGIVKDAQTDYLPGSPRLNEWGLSGAWTVGSEHAALNSSTGSITFRFHARDLHLVLGPSADGKPVRFRVKVDGVAPGNGKGGDIDEAGNGVVTGQRLYQLVRQTGSITDRTFEIEFLDPGVQAYAFTFG